MAKGDLFRRIYWYYIKEGYSDEEAREKVKDAWEKIVEKKRRREAIREKIRNLFGNNREIAEKPRKGVFYISEVAPNIADKLISNAKELIPEGIEKIECRFKKNSPLFLAIIHTKKGKLYALEGNSELLEEEDLEEMGFNDKKFGKIIDSVACVYAFYKLVMSDIPAKIFVEKSKISKVFYLVLRVDYPDYTADFIFR